MKYSKERKQAVIKKMLRPNNLSIAELSKQENISVPTLYNWRNEARRKGILLPAGDTSPEGWSSADKFSAVLATASMNEAEMSQYCREHGLYPEQIKEWHRACEQANDWDRNQNDRLKAAQKANEQQMRELQRELKKKEKALAETAALIVLRKKAEAIWGEPEDV